MFFKKNNVEITKASDVFRFVTKLQDNTVLVVNTDGTPLGDTPLNDPMETTIKQSIGKKVPVKILTISEFEEMVEILPEEGTLIEKQFMAGKLDPAEYIKILKIGLRHEVFHEHQQFLESIKTVSSIYKTILEKDPNLVEDAKLLMASGRADMLKIMSFLTRNAASISNISKMDFKVIVPEGLLRTFQKYI